MTTPDPLRAALERMTAAHDALARDPDDAAAWALWQAACDDVQRLHRPVEMRAKARAAKCDAETIAALKQRNRDAPPCPKGCGKLGTPSRETEQGRWYGPAESRLWCPRCGAGWYGTDAEVRQAEDAWSAYHLLCEMGLM